MPNTPDTDKVIELIGKAKGNILLNILQKVKKGTGLTAHETKQLEGYESEYKAKQEGVGRRIVGTQRELAEYIGKSERMISNYKRAGLPQNDDGTFDLDAIDEWFAIREGRRGISSPTQDGRPHTGDYPGWRAFLTEIKARTAESELSKLQGELISKEDVELQRVARITETKTALTGLERKLPPLLEGHDKRTMEKILHMEIEDLLNRFARPYGGDVR